MNQFDYELEELRCGGVVAKLRTARDGEMKPILKAGGKAEIFPSKEIALRSLIENLLRFLNVPLVRDGEVAGETRGEAEAFFKAPLRQKGKSRVITVAYKGQRQKCEAGKRSRRRDGGSPSTPTERST